MDRWIFLPVINATVFSTGTQKVIIQLKNYFGFGFSKNIEKDWKAKLKSAYSFRLKYSKIAVCHVTRSDFIEKIIGPRWPETGVAWIHKNVHHRVNKHGRNSN